MDITYSCNYNDDSDSKNIVKKKKKYSHWTES